MFILQSSNKLAKRKEFNETETCHISLTYMRLDMIETLDQQE